MLDIIFSIPIHQRLEVVVDQICNIMHFNPNCGCVFHLSQGFDYDGSSISKQQFLEIVSKFDNVYINPVSVRTGLGDIVQAHMANYEYALKVSDFKYFSILASNESFIKPGIADMVKKYDCGCLQIDVTDFDTNLYYAKCAQNDKFLKAFEKLTGCNRIFFSNIEGQYYKRELFDKIFSLINQFYDYKEVTDFYPREEYFFSTIVGYLKSKKEPIEIGPIFTYSAYHFGHLFDATPHEIRRIINKQCNIFTVKRVDRIFSDNVRCYLRQRYGYFEQEVSLLSNYISVERKSIVGIYISDLKKWSKTLWNKKSVILKRLGIK